MTQGYIYWKLFAAYNLYCKKRLFKKVTGIDKILEDYLDKTQSTGTKFTTLYHAVRVIQKYKPNYLLESGTGASTVVLAEVLHQLKKHNPNYNPKLISMESILKWHEMAHNLLPNRYMDVVEIRHGEREKFEYAMFRGYCHSNIPDLDYDFVFIDGPSYNDEYGSSSCLDALKVRLSSNSEKIVGVVDTRVSSVFVMQNLFSVGAIRYFDLIRTCWFNLHKIVRTPNLSSKSFDYSIWGGIRPKKKSFRNS